MNTIKNEKPLSLRQSFQLSQVSEVILKTGDYSEPHEKVHPYNTNGFALENEEQKELCGFYNYCLALTGFDSQIMCIKSDKIICRHKLFVRNLAE